MDPTKTISYRRWRNKLAGKGYLSLEPFGDESYKAPHRSAEDVGTEIQDPIQGETKLKKYCAKKRCDELQMQQLIKELEREYRKNDCFRKDKVANLKRLIKAGQYQVPGKAVVEKWFSPPSGPESRE
jgi:anti-sigma28 factor (negative regulator of flagellin synthesis)